MNAVSPQIGEADRLRLAPGVMLRNDRRRGEWMLMAPERLLVLDEMALAVVRACVGAEVADVAAGIDRLTAEYDAPRAEVAADVLEMLTDLRNKGYVVT
ncbi:pyrroloquinoline quinone biosynthesis peptide chaperone PqqD [Azospirillum lipoferum]|uniref:Coenzyme PQQ (Pyrroloquinoline quinone) synthesis protein D n=1 Tax=Azospirillum lipoferum (strain 4B) TaxID=862719 RepID=G7ZFN1_AZOL4|nr:pyrroloquinoline quinone biosynthesis peptide chaperone PqqD [Azospirillum lipoferum]CBS90399.1 Coenzyme PQQ (pyrroloquinoline quinone) synthesis protein D [Azospirillum lipoferum 4B]